LTPNKIDLIISGPNDCEKISSNSIQICDYGSDDRQTGRHTAAIFPCYAIAMGQIKILQITADNNITYEMD